MLYIVANYHCMQFQGKSINKTWENGKKPSLETNFGPFGPKNIFHEFNLYYMLNIVPGYHCVQCQGKLMNQAWKNSKNLVLGPILAHLAHQCFFQKSGPVSH